MKYPSLTHVPLPCNWVMLLSYDGSRFWGWQKTESGCSIEETVQTILEMILQHSVTLQAASRTDRGVNARGQVVNFFSTKLFDEKKMVMSINRLLPEDISVHFIKRAPFPAFHPTLNALSKEYYYSIDNGRFANPLIRNNHWHVHRPLDIELMKQAATRLLGEHDFSSLSNARKNKPYTHTIRTIEKLHILPNRDLSITFEIQGNKFLYKMARNIAGLLVYIGLGKIHLEEIEGILKSKKRSHYGFTAPAQGLCLNRVIYPFDLFP